MYAVIETGGKQYRVEVGTELQVELLDVEPGKTITLDRVLLVADGDTSSIGQPLVADAAVSAEVVRQIRGEKLISFKYRPKARSRVKKGHRQELTVLRISDITLDGKSAAKSAKKTEDDAKTERQRLEEAATVQAAKDAELAAKLAAAESATKSTRAKPKATAAETAPAAATKSAETKPADAKPAAARAAAKPKATTAAKPAAKATTNSEPKTSRSKASSDAPAKAADAPKRTRATKKDE
jgi:large subunit ribosomal protein L21